MVVLLEMIVPYSYKFGKDINNNGLIDIDLKIDVLGRFEKAVL